MRDINNNTLQNDNGSLMNATYNFTLLYDTIGPNLTNIQVMPNMTGYGVNITIEVDAIDAGSTDNISINITYPNGTNVISYMEHLTTYRWQYVFTDAWFLGQYNITLFANDTLGYNSTANSSFIINTTLDIAAATMKDIYFANQSVELTSPFSWWNTSWTYRQLYTMKANDYEKTNIKMISILNFTKLFGNLSVSGIFDINSIRLVEYFSDGSAKVYNSAESGDEKYLIPYNFTKRTHYSATTNAVGALEWVLNGTTAANQERYFMLYFDMEESGLKPESTQHLLKPDDFIIVTRDNGNIYYVESYGNGTFGSLNYLDDPNPSDYDYIRGVAVADFDNDGDYDFAIGATKSTNYANFYLYENQGNFVFNKVYTSPPVDMNQPYTMDIATGDFTNDGYMDFVVGGNNEYLYLFINNKSKGFNTPVRIPNTYSASRGKDAADIDGDGNYDFVMAISGGGGDIYKMLGDGTGNFTQSYIMDPTGGDPYCIALGDFDNDDEYDLIYGYSGGAGTTYFHKGLGGGTFNTTGVSIIVPNNYHSCDAYDFNNDGNLDLAMVTYTSDRLRVYFGNGDGTFNASFIEWNTGDTTLGIATPEFYSGEYSTSSPEARAESIIPSRVLNIGDTQSNFYLNVWVERFNNVTLKWDVVNDSINNSFDGVLLNSLLNLKSEFDSAGNWNTSNSSEGWYRIHVLLYDIYNNTLLNYNGSYLNQTYNFSISSDNEGPSYNNLVFIPDPAGYFSNVTIQVDVQDPSGVAQVWANITLPDNQTIIKNMSNNGTGSQMRYRAYFNDTVQYGDYNVTIYSNDTFGWVSNTWDILRITGNLSIALETESSIYYPNESVELVDSVATNVGATNFSAYLLMQVQFFNGSSWNVVNTTVNETTIRAINISNTVNLTQIWLNASPWNTTNSSNGTYRIYVEFNTGNNGNSSNRTVLQNDNGTYMNASYIFEIRNSTGIPAVNSLTISPTTSGYGTIVTITANITDDNNVSSAWMNLTYPNSTSFVANLTNISNDIYQYVFNDTWLWGDYNITVFANDTDSNQDEQSDQLFVRSNMELGLSTALDTYYHADIVTLTPYDWWNTSWHYRVPIIVDTGYTKRGKNQVIKELINFSAIITGTGKDYSNASMLDPDSIIVIDQDGNELDSDVVRWFNNGTVNRTAGMVRWKLSESAALDEETEYKYYIYFDTIDHGYKAAPSGYSMPKEFMICPSYYDVDYAYSYSNYDGTFTPLNFTETGSQIYARYSVVADFDNDGDYDFMLSKTSGTDYFLVYRNNGDSSWDFTLVDQQPEDVDWGGMCLADYNEDGYMDVAVMGDNGDPYILVNDAAGDSRFTATAAILPGLTSNGAAVPACGDFNGDGHADIITGNRGDGLRLFVGDGTGTAGGFSDMGDIADSNNKGAGGGNHDALGQWAVDVDHDGDLDLYALDWATNVYYYENNGTGSFANAQLVPGASLSVANRGDGSVWDFNNDGILDISRGDWSAAPNNAHINFGTGSTAYDTAFGTEKSAGNIATADNQMDCKGPEHFKDLTITEQAMESTYIFENSDASIINNTDSFGQNVYLYMAVQNYTSGAWSTINTIVNESTARNISGNDILDMSYMWLDYNSWNTTNSGYGNMTYRVYIELRSKNGSMLRNDDGSLLNISYNFSIIADTDAPVMEDIEVVPQTDGYGQNFTISAYITDQTDVSSAWLNITYPDLSKAIINMSIYQTFTYLNYKTYLYRYVFNKSWQWGNYSFVVFSNDTISQETNSSDYSFYVRANTTMSLNTTLQDYPPETYIIPKNSFINNTGFTNMSLHLLMQIVNATLDIVNTTVNESLPRYLPAGSNLNLTYIWLNSTNNTGYSTTGMSNGLYYLIVKVLSDNINSSSVLVNDNQTLMMINTTFNISIDTEPPVISTVVLSPQTTGYGNNVTITFNVTDNGNLDEVRLNISHLPEVSLDFNISPVSGNIYQYVFNNTWYPGDYNVTVWANDSTSNNASDWTVFKVAVNTSINTSTFKDIYQHDEIVELTSPYAWWNATWTYRVPIKLNKTWFNRTNLFLIENFNFTHYLSTLGISGTFDIDSMRIVEYYENGSMKIFNESMQGDRKYEVPFKSWQDPDFDSINNAVYKLRWKAGNKTYGESERVFQVYLILWNQAQKAQ